jgi:hypothetical protein
MKRNVGTGERTLRALAAALMLTRSVRAPLPLLARAVSFGDFGLYPLFAALSGTCLGCALIGRSTCSLSR